LFARCLALLLLCHALPVFGQAPGEASGREHFLPLIIDGGGFQTWLMLVNELEVPNQCVLMLQGPELTESRFRPHRDFSVTDSLASIWLDSQGSSVTLVSKGTEPLTFGYGEIECIGPVAARVLLSQRTAGAFTAMTALPSAAAATRFEFPWPEQVSSMGLALSNNSNAAATCSLELDASQNLPSRSISIPSRSTTFHLEPLPETVPTGFPGAALALSCDLPVGALGVPLAGATFASLPAAVLPSGSEEMATIPLVVDGVGFRSRLVVVNTSDAANQCSLTIHGDGLTARDFARSSGASGTAVTLPTPGAHEVLTSPGDPALAVGFATVECEHAATAHNFLSLQVQETLAGMTTVASVRSANGFEFPAMPRSGNYALIFANAAEQETNCQLELLDENGTALTQASIKLPGGASTIRFLDEFESAGTLGTQRVGASCDGAVAATGLPFAGAAFAALAPVLPGLSGGPQPSPLLIDRQGCQDGRFVTSPARNLAAVTDCLALVSFANAMLLNGSDQSGPLGSWGKEGQLRVGDWEGVTVISGRVTAIDLLEAGLRGKLPVQLSSLKSLQRLDLGSNELSGGIPPWLTRLARLRVLQLDGNQLGGAIPAGLASLKNLRSLTLGDNGLIGPIPAELGDLAELQILALQNNALSGTIPLQIANLEKLTQLNISGNRLSGEIPRQLAELPRLTALSLGDNNFKGTLPWEFQEHYLDWFDFHGITRRTLITGVEMPPPRERNPDYSSDPASNGNAAFHSFSVFQGPLVLQRAAADAGQQTHHGDDHRSHSEPD